MCYIKKTSLFREVFFHAKNIFSSDRKENNERKCEHEHTATTLKKSLEHEIKIYRKECIA